MATNRTVSELRKAAQISDDEIDAAVDAYLANPHADPFRFAYGYEIAVAAAIEADLPAKVTLGDPDRPAKFKRNMVRAAILLAYPVKR